MCRRCVFTVSWLIDSFGGDVAVAGAVRHARQHLALASRQARVQRLRLVRAGGAPLELGEELARQARIDPHTAGADGANRVDDRREARRLQNVAAGAAVGGAGDHVEIGERRQDERANRRVALEHAVEQRAEVAHVRHLVVEHQHVGADAVEDVEELLAVAGLADDVDLAGPGERDAHHLPKHRVVVR